MNLKITKNTNYLNETSYCDYKHPEIQKISKEIAKKHDDKRDIAIASFYWVRDNILWRLGLWNRRASETLAEREGTCTNKSNLLIALLRANNIQAGYGLLRVKGQKYLGPAVSRLVGKFVAKESVHVYTGVYFEKWLKIDPSDDYLLSENLGHMNSTAIKVDWDGYCDAELNISENNILTDEFPIDNLDYLFKKKPKNAKGYKLKLVNEGINFVRKHGKDKKSFKSFEPLIMQFLKSKYPVYYCLYRVASFYKDVQCKIRRINKKSAITEFAEE